MGSKMDRTEGLSLPRDVFARLTPRPFLEAHLERPNPIRPNGRGLTEARELKINTGSLSHSNGSAVVRIGDTAIVCGVRAEILLASNIPHPPREDVFDDIDSDLVEELGLLVPNLELSTGCSPAHLPGNPPGTLAQSLSHRILSLLHISRMVDLQDLRIQHCMPAADDGVDGGSRLVTKAYWTLYIDILCIALDGNPFDAAWAAVVAALHNTRLPKAHWDSDSEMIWCSPEFSTAHPLNARSAPIAVTLCAYPIAEPQREPREAEYRVLADPDAFEESVCTGTLTLTFAGADAPRRSGLLRVEQIGQLPPEVTFIEYCFGIAAERRKRLTISLQDG